MKKTQSKITAERTLDLIGLASWNRTRSTNEIRSFLNRREAAVADIEL